MELFALAWRFLLSHPATPYLVPLPWHLPVLLFVLGVLAALGLHHLIGYSYEFYLVRGRIAPTLAIPSLVILLVSAQALLVAYVLATSGGRMARQALNSDEALAAARPIGQRLLAPAFARLEGDAGPESEIEGQVIAEVLLTYTAEGLQQGFQADLESAQAAMAAHPAPVEEPSPAPPEGGKEGEAPAPAMPAAGTPERPRATSPALLLLTLHWLAGAHEHWAPVLPKTEEAEPAETPPEQDAEGTTQPQAEPPAEPPPPAPEGEPVPPLTRHILSLISEIPPQAILARADWEHVAGRRFLQRVLEPLMAWQVGYLAALLLTLVIAVNLLFFFGMRQLRRLLLKPSTSPTA